MDNGKAKKQFRHDCKCCVFVGSNISKKGQYDLYVTGGDGMYVARFSSAPGDYISCETAEELIVRINR